MKLYKLPILKTHKNDIEITQDTLARSIPKEKPDYYNKMLDYLKSGIVISAMAHINHDVFTGEKIPYEACVYTDGKYRWTSEIIYYVEKYNLILEKEFINHILKEETIKITEQDLFNDK